jgi:hypothetical protein
VRPHEQTEKPVFRGCWMWHDVKKGRRLSGVLPGCLLVFSGDAASFDFDEAADASDMRRGECPWRAYRYAVTPRWTTRVHSSSIYLRRNLPLGWRRTMATMTICGACVREIDRYPWRRCWRPSSGHTDKRQDCRGKNRTCDPVRYSFSLLNSGPTPN